MENDKKVKAFLTKFYKYPQTLSSNVKKRIDDIVFDATRIDGIKKLSFADKLISAFQNKRLQGAVLAFSCVVVLVGLGWLFIFNKNIPEQQKEKVMVEISVTSSATTEYGISGDSKFVVKLDENVSSEKIAEQIEITPKVEYDVDVVDGTLNIVPKEKLSADTIYTVKLSKGTELTDVTELEEDMMWMFVTEPEFEIINTIPGRWEMKVNTDSVIEIEFSYYDVVLDSVIENFTIEPFVEGNFQKYGNKILFFPYEELAGGVTYTVSVFLGVQSESKGEMNAEYSFSFITDYEEANQKFASINNGCFGNNNDGGLNIAIVNKNAVCQVGASGGILEVSAYGLGKEDDVRSWANVNSFGYIDGAEIEELEVVWTETYLLGENKKNVVKPDFADSGKYLLEYKWQYENIVETKYEIVSVGDLIFQLEKTEIDMVEGNLNFNEIVSEIEEIEIIFIDNEFDTVQRLITNYDGSFKIDNCVDCEYLKFKFNESWYYSEIPEYEGFEAYVEFDKPYYKTGDTVNFIGFTEKYSEDDYIRVKAYYLHENERILLLEDGYEIDSTYKNFVGRFDLPEGTSGEIICIFYNGDKVVGEKSLFIGQKGEEVLVNVVSENSWIENKGDVKIKINNLKESYPIYNDVELEVDITNFQGNYLNGKLLIQVIGGNGELAYWNPQLNVKEGKASVNFYISNFITDWSVVGLFYSADGSKVWFRDEFKSEADFFLLFDSNIELKVGEVSNVELEIINYTEISKSAILFPTVTGSCSLNSDTDLSIAIPSNGKVKKSIELKTEKAGECNLSLMLLDGEALLGFGDINLQIVGEDSSEVSIVTVLPNEQFTFDFEYDGNNTVSISLDGSNIYKSVSDVNNVDDAIRALLYSSLSDFDSKVVDKALRILYENINHSSCFSWNKSKECALEDVVMAKIAISEIKSRGIIIWDKWETDLNKFLESNLYLDNLSLDQKLMVVWALSYEKNTRTLAMVLNVYSRIDELNSLELAYLLLAVDNYSIKTMVKDIQNRLKKISIDMDMGMGMDNEIIGSRYMKAISLVGTRFGDIVNDKILCEFKYEISKVNTIDGFWYMRFLNQIERGNTETYSILVNDVLMGEYLINVDKLIKIDETYNEIGRNEITLRNNGLSPIVVVIRY